MIRTLFIEHYNYLNLFFAFSFLGWIMECIVIRLQNGYFENRGFAHSPFCIIYGFGALLCNYFAQPFGKNYIAIYIFGAIGATIFEYITAKLMIRLFGKFWWDYAEKPFNYKGIICLESTIGWGFVSVFIVGFLYNFLFGFVSKAPEILGQRLAILLLIGYSIDFFVSLRTSRKEAIIWRSKRI